MTAQRVLVTGAGGKTGRAVLAALGRRGLAARALVRSDDRAAELTAELHQHDHLDVEVVVGDQRRVDDLTGALDGVDAVYAIAPNVSPHEVEMGDAVVSACLRAGVKRLVVHSVIHPQRSSMPHHADKGRVEELVIGSGLAWTILQPNAYLQNLAGYVDQLRDGRYPVPYATDRGLAMVDLADVADVATRVLADDIGVHATFELCGPDEVTPRDVAATAADLLGREVVATRQDPRDWEAANAKLPAETRRRLLAMFRAYDAVGSPGDATVLTTLLGRAPGDLHRYLAGLLRTAG